MQREILIGMSKFVPAALVTAVLLVIGMHGPDARAQEVEITLEPSPISDLDTLARARSEADAEFDEAVRSAGENRFRRAASMYEEITQEFSLDTRHLDAYFSAAYVYMEYLQTVTDYEQASNLYSILISNHSHEYGLVADAFVARAHLNYRCKRDYRAAQRDLSHVLNERDLRITLGGDREFDVKALLARCRQKLGEYEEARMLWDEISFEHPEQDTEGRRQWIEDSASWYTIDAEGIRFFFKDNIPQTTYMECLSEIQDGLSAAYETWGLDPVPVDVYLYDTSDHLFDFTLRSKGFVLTVDSEIHLAVEDIPNAGHLAGWVASQGLNIRPEATVFPMLRAGFNHYFLGSRRELDDLAAREIYFYGGNIPEADLVFPLSFDYTYSDEYCNIAASFMHYLIEEERVSLDDLQRFYRLLSARPDRMIQPPLMTRLLLTEIEGETRTWMEGQLTRPQVYSLYQTSLGINLSDEIAEWNDSLRDEIADIETQLGTFSAEVRRVDLDLSTPQNALGSWWEAYRSGDFDGLIGASTNEMAQFLSETREFYEDEGILEQVIIEEFIRPYRSANMIVVQMGSFGDSLAVFEVLIEQGSEAESMTIVVRKEGNSWRVDSN